VFVDGDFFHAYNAAAAAAAGVAAAVGNITAAVTATVAAASTTIATTTTAASAATSRGRRGEWVWRKNGDAAVGTPKSEHPPVWKQQRPRPTHQQPAPLFLKVRVVALVKLVVVQMAGAAAAAASAAATSARIGANPAAIERSILAHDKQIADGPTPKPKHRGSVDGWKRRRCGHFSCSRRCCRRRFSCSRCCCFCRRCFRCQRDGTKQRRLIACIVIITFATAPTDTTAQPPHDFGSVHVAASSDARHLQQRLSAG